MSRMLAAALLAVISFGVLAQDYPSKPIRIVIPYPPGGASDVTARLLGQKLAEAWSVQVIADNRPGANGILALDHVAKSAPDGYTLLMANLGPNAINPAVYSKLPYDPIRDFSTVTLTTMVPQVLVASPSLEARSVRELVALAKAAPGKINYGNGGNGSANHLAVELMASIVGIKLTSIPYKGDGPAMIDAMSGQVALTLPTVVAALPNIKSGKLRALAVTTKQRVASLADIPTMEEAGVPGYESVSWGGIMVPAGTPVAVVNRLHAELVRILKMQEVEERLAGLGATVVASGPAEFATFLQAEIRKWDGVAKKAGIRLE